MFKVVGDFHLKHRIGKGNYADVYLGEHKTTGKPYAIKVIAKERFSHPKLISGLESEVKIMREFTHRNIVQLERYFSSQNNFYLVLDYCAGGDLSKFIKKSQRLRENTAFNFLSQIADGISFLNERNFIHRDLKSANVLLTETSPNATLKIADFGFARQLQGDALAGTACGTPLYMAPEILEAREYDAKADIWSIGCIFYEMLAGHCPFSGVNETDLLNNIRTKELRVPSDVSKVSVGILVKLLERQSTRRASIQDLVAVCQRISASLAEGGDGSSSTPPPSVTAGAATAGEKQAGSAEKSGYGQFAPEPIVQQGQQEPPQSALTASLAAGDRQLQLQQQQGGGDNNNQSDVFANFGHGMKDGLDDSRNHHNDKPLMQIPSMSTHNTVSVNSNKSALSAKLEEQQLQQQKSKFKPNTSSPGSGQGGADNYSNNINDSDFVFINDTDATYPMRGGYHSGNNTQQQPSANNLGLSSSLNYYAQQQQDINPLAQQLRQEQLRAQEQQEQFDQQEQDAREQAQFFQQNILQRWEVYGSVVHVVNNLADHIVRSEEHHLSLLNNNANNDQLNLTPQNLDNLGNQGNLGGLGEQAQNLGNNTKQLTDSLNNFLAASILYLHAMAILRTFMISFELPDLPPQATAEDAQDEYGNSGNKGMHGLILMHRMRSDVTLVFEQLLSRAESCHRILDFYSNYNNYGNKVKLVPPKAEYLMLKEAVRHEAEGETEEMLGNMERACSLYESSKKLVYGVSLTFTSSSTSPSAGNEDDDCNNSTQSNNSHQSNNRKVQSQLKAFCEGLEQKIFACRQRSQFVGGGRFGGGLFGDE